jgi:ribA/ribD-fused uncharacterized protein
MAGGRLDECPMTVVIEKEKMKIIDVFRGDYYFLSNFYSAPVMYEGLLYYNNECAFQSAKTLNKELRESFAELDDPSVAKKSGKLLHLRPDWENVKDEVMYQIVKNKFTRNADLKQKLLNTGDAELVEGNIWGDTYWGVCKGKGQNKLGKILMRVRKETKEELSHVFEIKV